LHRINCYNQGKQPAEIDTIREPKRFTDILIEKPEPGNFKNIKMTPLKKLLEREGASPWRVPFFSRVIKNKKAL
jgi:hypothetical protein